MIHANSSNHQNSVKLSAAEEAENVKAADDPMENFSYSDFDQMEFITEEEVASLGPYEVLMDLDLELVS